MKKYENREHVFSMSVGGLIIFDNSEVLLVKKRNGGHWTLPSGFLKTHEEIKSVLEREIFEETNVRTTELENKGIVTIRHRHNKKIGNNVWIVFLLETKSKYQIKSNDPEEIENVAFFEIQEILDSEISDAVTKELLKKYKDNSKNCTLKPSDKNLAKSDDSFYNLFL